MAGHTLVHAPRPLGRPDRRVGRRPASRSRNSGPCGAADRGSPPRRRCAGRHRRQSADGTSARSPRAPATTSHGCDHTAHVGEPGPNTPWSSRRRDACGGLTTYASGLNETLFSSGSCRSDGGADVRAEAPSRAELDRADSPSRSPPACGSMSHASKCAKVPTGASGSSTISTSTRVPGGGSLQDSAGRHRRRLTCGGGGSRRRAPRPPCSARELGHADELGDGSVMRITASPVPSPERRVAGSWVLTAGRFRILLGRARDCLDPPLPIAVSGRQASGQVRTRMPGCVGGAGGEPAPSSIVG
jgi:hypothetical protein